MSVNSKKQKCKKNMKRKKENFLAVEIVGIPQRFSVDGWLSFRVTTVDDPFTIKRYFCKKNRKKANHQCNFFREPLPMRHRKYQRM